MFYLSYGRESGPNQMSDGAVWKFNPKNGAWVDITPVHPYDANLTFGYGCVAVDAQYPSVIMATTFTHWTPHDEIYRSTNGGATGRNYGTTTLQSEHSSAPYTSKHTPHWLGTVVINPFNSNRMLFTTGYGVWYYTNATAADAGKPTRWVFLDEGLEETVPLALMSPPTGPHLISGVGDIDGFRHDDLDKSPVAGTFSGQRYGNTEDLAFAGKNQTSSSAPALGEVAEPTASSTPPFQRTEARPGKPSAANRRTAVVPAASPFPPTAKPSSGRRGAANRPAPWMKGFIGLLVRDFRPVFASSPTGKSGSVLRLRHACRSGSGQHQ